MTCPPTSRDAHEETSRWRGPSAIRRGGSSSDQLDRQLVPGEEGVGLGAGEDAGGGAHGADAAGADGAGELEAFELGEVVEQAGDVAGGEGVAPPRAVDERDRVGAQAGAEAVGEGDGPPAPPGDDD